MAFEETSRNANLLLTTVRRTFVFTGRARRTEVACWLIVTTLMCQLADAIVVKLVSEDAGRGADLALGTLFTIPLFALLVRRLHDQDRSGWWALILPAALAMSLPKALASTSGDAAARIAAQPHGLLTIVFLFLILALFAFSLAPETIGPNRFGPDPREEPLGESDASTAEA